MDLGTFSISLAVKDIEASRGFYEKLGFKAFAVLRSYVRHLGLAGFVALAKRTVEEVLADIV